MTLSDIEIMNSNSVKKIRRIGTFFIITGCFLVLGFGISTIMTQFSDNYSELLITTNFIMSSIVIISGSVLLIISGLLIIRISKTGLLFAVFTVVIIYFLTIIYWISDIHRFNNIPEIIQTSSMIIITLVFFPLGIMIIKFLLKEETKKLFK
jgi:uncharacterized membrane protein